MTYPSKLSEELKRVQGVTEKIKVMEIAYNELARKQEEMATELANLSKLTVDEYAEIKARFEMFKAELDRRKSTKSAPSSMTAKAMATKLGIGSNPEKYMALKFFARKFCEEHGLSISHNTDTKKHDQFPLAAAIYAMEQVGGKKK